MVMGVTAPSSISRKNGESMRTVYVCVMMLGLALAASKASISALHLKKMVKVFLYLCMVCLCVSAARYHEKKQQFASFLHSSQEAEDFWDFCPKSG
jgi:hypothetical protein